MLHTTQIKCHNIWRQRTPTNAPIICAKNRYVVQELHNICKYITKHMKTYYTTYEKTLYNI